MWLPVSAIKQAICRLKLIVPCFPHPIKLYVSEIPCNWFWWACTHCKHTRSFWSQWPHQEQLASNMSHFSSIKRTKAEFLAAKQRTVTVAAIDEQSPTALSVNAVSVKHKSLSAKSACRLPKEAKPENCLSFSAPRCALHETFLWEGQSFVVEKKVLASGTYGEVHRWNNSPLLQQWDTTQWNFQEFTVPSTAAIQITSSCEPQHLFTCLSMHSRVKCFQVQYANSICTFEVNCLRCPAGHGLLSPPRGCWQWRLWLTRHQARGHWLMQRRSARRTSIASVYLWLGTSATSKTSSNTRLT